MSAFAPDCPLSPRERVVVVARVLHGSLYVWGGNTLADGGTDCSGFVQLCYAEAGVEPWASQYPRQRDLTAAGLWDALAPVPDAHHALPGDLAFYGEKRADGSMRIFHVMLVTRHTPGEDACEVVGASKGDSTCTDAVIAKRKGARVVTHPRHDYWRAFVGFRRMPGA